MRGNISVIREGLSEKKKKKKKKKTTTTKNKKKQKNKLILYPNSDCSDHHAQAQFDHGPSRWTYLDDNEYPDQTAHSRSLIWVFVASISLIWAFIVRLSNKGPCSCDSHHLKVQLVLMEHGYQTWTS